MALVNGHEVPDELVEYFYHGSDGTPLTDEEWDITRDRMRAVGAWPFDQ